MVNESLYFLHYFMVTVSKYIRDRFILLPWSKPCLLTVHLLWVGKARVIAGIFVDLTIISQVKATFCGWGTHLFPLLHFYFLAVGWAVWHNRSSCHDHASGHLDKGPGSFVPLKPRSHLSTNSWPCKLMAFWNRKLTNIHCAWDVSKKSENNLDILLGVIIIL